MSQLELALRKARRLEVAARGGTPERSSANARIAAWAFTSAWEFDSTVEAPAETYAEESPAQDAAVHLERRRDTPQFREFSSDVRDKLVVGEHALPELREQFRKLAATLYGLQKERDLKIVMIVSALPGEGKTLTATNFALTLSESYRSRVLLVDADLRRPSVHKIFDIPNEIGLKEALTSGADTRLSTVRITSRLEVLTAGTTVVDPMEALTSNLLRLRLGAAARAFDWVVLDTPPVELLPDATILGGLADAAILIVEAAVTKCELAQRAVDAIGRDSVIGVVLNQLPAATRRARYRDYQYSERYALTENS